MQDEKVNIIQENFERFVKENENSNPFMKFLNTFNEDFMPDDTQDQQLSVIPMPLDLRNQLSLLTSHLALGMLCSPVDRVWIAVDSHLFLWNAFDRGGDDSNEDDIAYFDIGNEIVLMVDVASPVPNLKSKPDCFLIVATPYRVSLYPMTLQPNLCVVTEKPLFSFFDGELLVSALACSENGRIFFGTKNGKVMELTYAHSDYWGSSCNVSEVKGFGCGFLRSFFLSGLLNSVEAPPVLQLCVHKDVLYVRRPNEVQSLDFSCNAGGRSPYTFKTQPENKPLAICPVLDKHILVVTSQGHRIIFNEYMEQVINVTSPSLPSSSAQAAFIDRHTGSVLLQMEEGIYFLQRKTWSRLKEGSMWAFSVIQKPTSLEHSVFLRQDVSFVILTVNALYRWTRPSPSYVIQAQLTRRITPSNYAIALLVSLENPSYLSVVIPHLKFALPELLSDLFSPYWNKPMVRYFNAADENSPIVSTIPSDDTISLHVIVDKLNNVLNKPQSPFLQRLRDVMAAWRLVSAEHQLHAIVEQLPAFVKGRLVDSTLRSLCVDTDSDEILRPLLSALVQLYMDDKAATDALIARLCQLAPSFFTPEAALLAQASERLQRLSSASPESRALLISEAASLLYKAAASVDLYVWAPVLDKLELYSELVALTLKVASRHDPQNIALNYYLSSYSIDDDMEGSRMFIQRQRTYRIIFEICGSNEHAYSAIVNSILNSNDELAHVALFEWILSKEDYLEEILEIKSKYLIRYLNWLSSDRPLVALDVLWRVYESLNDYASASSTLTNLASFANSGIDIQQRFQYLSRALVLERSASNYNTDRLNELQALVDVARVQLRIAEALRGTSAESRIRYEKLFTATELYEQYAEPYNMYHIQLNIMALADYYDIQLINDLWCLIIDQYFTESDSEIIKVVLGTLPNLHDSRYLPVKFIVRVFETRSAEENYHPGWGLEFLLDVGFSPSLLIKGYASLRSPTKHPSLTPVRVALILGSFYNKVPEILPLIRSPNEREALSSHLLSIVDRHINEMKALISEGDDNVTDAVKSAKVCQRILERNKII